MIFCRLHRPGKAIAQAATLAVIGFLTTGPAAQGLGEVAKKEAERRQQVSAGKRYTNESLPADVGSTGSSAQKAQEATAEQASKPQSPKGAASPTQEPSKDSAPKPVTEQKDSHSESYWRDKANEIRRHLQQNRTQVQSLQGRLSELDSQPATPSVANEREVTLKALASAQKNVGYFQDMWNNFEARARASKISPDWIQ